MIASLLRFLHRRCRHPGDNVVADILEGDRDGRPVMWCRTCGAIMRSRNLWELAVDPRPRGIVARPALALVALVAFLLAAPALATPKLQVLQPQPVAGGVAYTWPGPFHSPAPGAEIAVANLPATGAYARAVLEVDITFGGWADGAQSMFWFHRGLCCWPKWNGGIVGYANVSQNGWRVVSDVGLTPQKSAAQGKWSPEVGRVYRMRYDYDAGRGVATFQIWDGTTLAAERAMAIPRGDLGVAGGGFMAYFGHESAAGHGPERPSYGWTYGNLRVSLTSGGEPVPVPPPPPAPAPPPPPSGRLCVGLDVTGGVVRSAATGERFCPPEVP